MVDSVYVRNTEALTLVRIPDKKTNRQKDRQTVERTSRHVKRTDFQTIERTMDKQTNDRMTEWIYGLPDNQANRPDHKIMKLSWSEVKICSYAKTLNIENTTKNFNVCLNSSLRS